MPNGICHNYLIDHGVMVNIPQAFKDVEFTILDKGTIDEFPKQNPFIPSRIVINFGLRDPNKDRDIKICIPVSITVFIERGDLVPGFTINDLNIADWDGSRWNVLSLNLERWVFHIPIRLNNIDYIGYIKADTCIAGDPPIAVGK
jgi:hypothetical protein